ncbi:hypothetical protein GE061_007145 [Apolygus lucorum]|uniref:Uncharacterized protein n=1 Tax=Apolygus lucorum TaxID=248454 RepID=A0A8S9WQB7_APOLU|nr:hypothetical protein GE061_007145 [Apolygus lucorum]
MAAVSSLKRFDSESLTAYAERAELYFARHKIVENSDQCYDFFTGLDPPNYDKMMKAILPKTLKDIKWNEILAALQSLEKEDVNNNRFKFLTFSCPSDISIQEFANVLRALGSKCLWPEDGLEICLQNRFMQCFSEPHIIAALLALKADAKFSEMVSAAITAQTVYDNTARRAMPSPVVAPISAKYNKKSSNRPKVADKTTVFASRRQFPRCTECFVTHQPSSCKSLSAVCERCKIKGHIASVCQASIPVSHVPSKVTKAPRRSSALAFTEEEELEHGHQEEVLAAMESLTMG